MVLLGEALLFIAHYLILPELPDQNPAQVWDGSAMPGIAGVISKCGCKMGDKERILCGCPHAQRLFQFRAGGNDADPCREMIRTRLWVQLLDLVADCCHKADPCMQEKFVPGPYWSAGLGLLR